MTTVGNLPHFHALMRRCFDRMTKQGRGALTKRLADIIREQPIDDPNLTPVQYHWFLKSYHAEFEKIAPTPERDAAIGWLVREREALERTAREAEQRVTRKAADKEARKASADDLQERHWRETRSLHRKHDNECDALASALNNKLDTIGEDPGGANRAAVAHAFMVQRSDNVVRQDRELRDLRRRQRAERAVEAGEC